MKKQLEKLSVNKSTIANFAKNELEQLFVVPTDFCTEYAPRCVLMA